ncbi:hypothetical protein N0V95_009481 [Ascochyta clinopodiicola]|nr:hypothetical protein N0V95_009481 [Ascochyta clinopodiicola]
MTPTSPPSSPPTLQAPISPLELSTGTDTEPAPSSPATSPSSEAEKEEKMNGITNDAQVDDMLTGWAAEKASEHPLEPSPGNVETSAPLLEPKTAPWAVAEGGQLKRKILPLRKRRGAAPQPAAPELGGDGAE